MTKLFNLSLMLAVGLLTHSCLKPETIPDGTIDGIECNLADPESCGPVACSEVHTNATSIPPVHYDASTCGLNLIGKACLDGIFLSKLINIVDDFCTENGNCTFSDNQALAQAKAALKIIRK